MTTLTGGSTLPVDGWIQTFSGHRVWPMHAAGTFVIEDISHALSLLCRYGGHCREFYSVAQHSVLASRICNPLFAQWCLMHDAAEAYIGDIVRPVKTRLRYWDEEDCDYPRVSVAELRLLQNIGDVFGLPPEIPHDEIKRVDRLLLANERTQLMSPHCLEWLPEERVDLADARNRIEITPWPALQAEQEFLRRARQLGIGNRN